MINIDYKKIGRKVIILTTFIIILLCCALNLNSVEAVKSLSDVKIYHAEKGKDYMNNSYWVYSPEILLMNEYVTFASLAKTAGNNGNYSGKKLSVTSVELVVLTTTVDSAPGQSGATYNINHHPSLNSTIGEAIVPKYTDNYYGIMETTIILYYDIKETPVEPGTLKVHIDYVASQQAHDTSGNPYCTSYTDSSKILRTSSKTLQEGTNSVYVDVGNAPKVAIGSYVGSNKALHIKYVSSDSTKALTKSGYSFKVTLDSSGNVKVEEPSEYTTYRNANPGSGSSQPATYTLSQLNGELHIVVECKATITEDEDEEEPSTPPYEVTPDQPYTPPVYVEPEVQNGQDSETRTQFKLEHLNPIAKAMIRSDEVSNEKYNNLHVGDKYFGIPTSETQWCYLEITFNMYRLGYEKVEGVKYYDVTVTTEYSYPYTETVNGKEVEKTGTYTVERVYQYERNYEYYTVTAYDAYQLIRADVVNDTLTGAGRVTMYEGDLQLSNGVKCPGDHTDEYNGEHMRLTLNGTSIEDHMNATEEDMQIRLVRTATSKADAREQAAQELGVNVSGLGASSDIKNKTGTNNEIKSYSNNNDSNRIWKEASDKTVLTVENDEIFHGAFIDRDTGELHIVYLMKLSTATTNNANDVAKTESPAETADEQNILEILRWLIEVPTTVSNEEYDSHIEGYYKRADDSLISGIRGGGVPPFPASEPPPFLQKI